MLKLLLDEHISPAVADGLRRRNRQLVVFCMTEWEDGEFLGQQDPSCLKRYSPRDFPSSAAFFPDGTLWQACRFCPVWGLVFEELADALDYNHQTSGFRHHCGH
jgi:hypothetical protein